MRLTLLAPLLLVACAAPQEYVWDKYGASEQDFNMDAGQCRAQAFQMPGSSLQRSAVVYASCMQGKGWAQRPK